MISRQWRAVARTSDADRYISHLRMDTLPRLSNIPGFLAASILRRIVADGVEFCVVTTWDSMEAIRKFAGDDPERAVVPEKVKEMMITYDRTVEHYDVIQ